MMSAKSARVGRRAPNWPRTLALVLAIGGCFWGLLASPLLVTPLAVAVLGPGYSVTLGYIIRAAGTPPLPARRLIWASSLLVQGAWLAWFAWALVAKLAAGGTLNEPLVPATWWALAVAASVVGLLIEKPDAA
jgi:hypothetical protein